MTIKLVVAAPNESSALEDYSKYSADMYVCFTTRENEFVNKYGAEKVCVIEMRSPTVFFIQVAHIPAGENVIIFNNNKGGAEVTLKYLRDYQINHCHRDGSFDTLTFAC